MTTAAAANTGAAGGGYANNQPGGGYANNQHSREMIKKINNNKQPAWPTQWQQHQRQRNAYAKPCQHCPPINGVGKLWYNINWQEEMWKKFVSNFVAHLPVLRPLAATAGCCNRRNHVGDPTINAKSSNQPVCVEREWMKESEDAKTEQHNNRTTINLPVPCSHASESKNSNQPAAACHLAFSTAVGPSRARP